MIHVVAWWQSCELEEKKDFHRKLKSSEILISKKQQIKSTAPLSSSVTSNNKVFYIIKLHRKSYLTEDSFRFPISS